MSDYTPTTEDVEARWMEGFEGDAGAQKTDRLERYERFQRWLSEHDRQVAARTRREVLNALPLPDEDARSGMIHARGLIAAHIIEQEGAGQ